ncbi:hypothetical protein JCM6882_005978 [Rhodosporidiobolus microsporus]
MAPTTTVLAVPSTVDKADLPTNNTASFWFKDRGLRTLNFHCAVLMLGSFVCGFDGSIMNGFFGLATFLRDTDNPDANKQGLLTAAISLGYLIGFLPASWLSDRYGRRYPQLFGAAVVVAAVLVQVFALGGWNFFGARLLLGFGAAFPLTAGSAHLFELVHPRQSATMATLFGATYWVGSVVASWSTFGFSYMSSNWSWRAPALLQGLASLIQLFALYFVPESPRWLVAQGRSEEAKEILAKYHANGDGDDELVLAELAEIHTAIELEKEAAGFGYLDFLKTKGNRYRLFLCCFIGFQTQFLGNTLLSYYLLPILGTLGVTSVTSQQGINGGLQIFNLATATAASVYINKFSRRFTWLFSTFGVLICFSMITCTSAIYDQNASQHAGRATIAFIFLYSGFYNVAWSVQFYSYVLEILPFGQRTKGMAICLFVDYAALFFAQYANPPAFNALGWKYYFIYIALIFITLFVVYFLFPETANLTLEQSAALLDGADAQAKLTTAAKTAVVAEGSKKDDELSV